MGFDGILMASYIVLLHALRKTKNAKNMSGFGWTLRAAIL